MAIRPAQILSNTRHVILAIGVSALCGVLLAGIALPVVAGIGVGARESADAFEEMPTEFEITRMDQRSRVVDADGRTLALFYDNKNYNDGNRVYVGLDRIAPVMRDAILAIEDDRFYDRGPIDFQGTLRALINNAQEGETTGGGSTLTQQYVKQTRLTQAKTEEERAAVQASDGVAGYRRKLEELRIAVSIEQEYTKDEILERYLNIVYFGNGAYGVEAAARTYFGKTAKTLTIRESALLAGMVQNPPRYDPVEKDTKNAAINRRDTVLNRMADTERITEAQAAKAKKRNLGLDFHYPDNGCVDSWAGYFCDYIRQELLTMKELGKNRAARLRTLETGGLTIQTTLDRDAQRAADEAVHDRANSTDNAIVSLASVEPGTGYVRAMSNSRKYGIEGDGVSNINYAVDYKLGGGDGIQPGSTFKVFVLAAAIDQGIGLSTSIRAPDQLHYGTEYWDTCDGSAPAVNWDPGNYEGASPGTYNLRTGTEQSVNTFYIQLSQRTGLCEPARIAEKSGVHQANAGKKDTDGEIVPPELQQVPAFTLGVNTVSPLSMAEAYATFANRGVHCDSTGVLSVIDNNGKKIVDHSKPMCERVLDRNVADTVNEVLQGVMTNGTGSGVQLDGRPAAGKTGTTNDFVAVWFAGYTPQLATAVAVADVDGRLTSLEGRTLGGEYLDSPSGSGTAGPVWQEFMNSAHEGRDVKSFADADEDTVRGKTATVPDVRGRSTEDAIAILRDKGFIASVSDEKNSDRPKGEVLGTEPGAGSEVTAGSYIGLVVSNGKDGGNDDGGGDGNDGGGDGNDRGDEWGGQLPEPTPNPGRIDDD